MFDRRKKVRTNCSAAFSVMKSDDECHQSLKLLGFINTPGAKSLKLR